MVKAGEGGGGESWQAKETWHKTIILIEVMRVLLNGSQIHINCPNFVPFLVGFWLVCGGWSASTRGSVVRMWANEREKKGLNSEEREGGGGGPSGKRARVQTIKNFACHASVKDFFFSYWSWWAAGGEKWMEKFTQNRSSPSQWWRWAGWVWNCCSEFAFVCRFGAMQR